MRMTIAAGLLFLSGIVPASAADPGSDPISPLADELLTGMRPCSPAEHFEGKELFDYMNGGAELYLAYGFEDIGVRNYRKGDVQLTIEIFHLKNPADAFGAFAHGARGRRVEIGVKAALARGMLSFYKGRMYVRVIAASNPAGAGKLLLSVGKALASRIEGKTMAPEGASKLPRGAIEGSLRYLPNPDTARTVWFDGEGEILLTKGARAFTAFYSAGDSDVQLTRVDYPSRKEAVEACLSLAGNFGIEADAKGGRCRAAGKTSGDVYLAMRTKKSVLCLSIGADNEKSAIEWMRKITP